jgi:hypothetical protein
VLCPSYALIQYKLHLRKLDTRKEFLTFPFSET